MVLLVEIESNALLLFFAIDIMKQTTSLKIQ